MENERNGLAGLRDSLIALLRELGSADPQKAECFADLLERSMAFLGLQPKDLAEDLGTSQASVSRWRTERNTPYPSMRRQVYGVLERRAGSFLRGVELRLAQLAEAGGEDAGASRVVATDRRVKDRRVQAR